MLIQIGLGTFFAHKLRSAVLYEILQHSNDAATGKAALEQYQKARDAWATMAERAKNVYCANVSYGSIPKRSGHWLDRLPGIDVDLAAMKAKTQQNKAEGISPTAAGMTEISGIQRSASMVKSTPPEKFSPGETLTLKLVSAGRDGGQPVRTVRLRYRHVNQAERWNALVASGEDGTYTAVIPSEYTESKFALEYYFELEGGRGVKWIYPGFNKTFSNQPYFAVCKRTG